jgi:hypothetical protein
MSVAIALGCPDQPLDLGLGQVLAAPKYAFGRRFGATVRFSMVGAATPRCDFIGLCPLPANQLLEECTFIEQLQSAAAAGAR